MMGHATTGKAVTKWMPMPRALVLVTALSLTLGGCIASYGTRHEEPSYAAPDPVHVCRYKWSVVAPRATSENELSRNLKPARLYGQSVASIVEELTAGCPSDDVGRVGAQVSAYYLRYANQAVRDIAALPLAFLSGATLGLLPIPATDSFVACVEITTSDGTKRTALARGELDMAANFWGSIGPPESSGNTYSTQQQDKILRELTIRAWNKAWSPRAAMGGNIADCRDARELILRSGKQQATE